MLSRCNLYVDDSSTCMITPSSAVVCGVLVPGQLVPCPKDVTVDSLPKYLLWYFPVQYYTGEINNNN